MIPVRCYTCGKVISNVWDEYKARTEHEDEDPGKVMDSLGIERYCCRRMLLTHVELMDEIAPYE
ncbi:MAG: DNA-directed RNA polymerase subunit N [Methanophagales archaeon]|nr:DNA-directed RNA polymerase subunit N [Methanophagales archaeon]